MLNGDSHAASAFGHAGGSWQTASDADRIAGSVISIRLHRECTAATSTTPFQTVGRNAAGVEWRRLKQFQWDARMTAGITTRSARRVHDFLRHHSQEATICLNLWLSTSCSKVYHVILFPLVTECENFIDIHPQFSSMLFIHRQTDWSDCKISSISLE